ncbi:MAG TPA: EamA family transporter [Bacteroidales bacterium]|nr:DMT family transporter [Bacteroidales bacterium]HQH41146.1 EamA family transporter [Bacteroidales bacterium]
MKTDKLWLLFAFITTSFWGVWGAFMEIPEKSGFPATLGYVVWSLTMIPCALFALSRIEWKPEHDKRSVLLGSSVGLLGAGGQLILFQALRQGPAYIVFPIISLYPVLTIFLSLLFLKERANTRQWAGIVLALIAMFLLSNPQVNPGKTEGIGWLALAIMVFIMWGIQAWVMKFSNNTMKAESIFFYMALTGVLLSPFAFAMTDFASPINWSFKGPWLSAMIQILNAIGALSLVYALRYGKAIIVVPLTGLAPVITVILSLIIYGVIPGGVLLAGLITASVAIVLLSQ